MSAENRVVARLAVYAEMCDFPCSKQELLQMAEEQQFPDEVLNVLEDVPNGNYNCESDLVEAAGAVLGTGPARREHGVEVER